MRRGSAILIAAIAGVLPAASLAAPPAPPAALVQTYSLHGALSRYVPAKFGDGSITITVNAASVNAKYAIGTTLTFRLTSATTVQFGRLDKSATGWVKMTGSDLRSSLALQARVPSVVTLDTLGTVPVSRI